MSIPSEVHDEVERVLDAYCTKPLPPHARGKIRYGYVTRGMIVTLYHECPHFKDKSKWVRMDVARFRYNKTVGMWTLYYADQNSRWHVFPPAESSSDISDLLDVVEEDPTGIFWG